MSAVAAGGPPSATRWRGRRWLPLPGGRRVSTYVAMLYLGCVLGTWAGAAVAAADGLDPARFVVATAALLVPAIMGSRLAYVLAHRAAYRGNGRRAWRRDEGGAALYGGLVLAPLVGGPVLAALGLPAWRFWDASAVTMLVGLAVTRLGCTANGCCLGRDAAPPWGAWLPDGAGRWARRIPVAPIEAGLGVAGLVVVLAVGDRLPFAGARILAVVGGYGLVRVALAVARDGDGAERRGRIAASAAVVAAVVVLWVGRSIGS